MILVLQMHKNPKDQPTSVVKSSNVPPKFNKTSMWLKFTMLLFHKSTSKSLLNRSNCPSKTKRTHMISNLKISSIELFSTLRPKNTKFWELMILILQLKKLRSQQIKRSKIAKLVDGTLSKILCKIMKSLKLLTF